MTDIGEPSCGGNCRPSRQDGEKTLQNAILRKYGTRSDMRLWRVNTGVARFGDRVVRFGVAGQADLSGIIRGGTRLEIECKTTSGRQSKKQLAWQLMIERFGGIYILARCIEDVDKRLLDILKVNSNRKV